MEPSAPDIDSDTPAGRIVVVIPALDPPPALVPLVCSVTGQGLEVLVVDDGSQPDADNKFLAVKGRPGARVLRHAIHYGKGAALKTAFRQLVQERPPVDAVITVAADGRHAPEDVLALAAVARSSPQAMVLGVRRCASELPLKRKLVKVVLEAAFRLRTGQRLHDLQTGLRVLPRSLMLEALTIHANGYDFDAALLRRGVAWQREVVELPVGTTYGQGQHHSWDEGWRGWSRVLRCLLGRLERH